METLTVLNWVIPQKQCDYAKKRVKKHHIASNTEDVIIVIPALKVNT